MLPNPYFVCFVVIYMLLRGEKNCGHGEKMTNRHRRQVIFTEDGRSIVTGWSDGGVRFYTPESGFEAKMIVTTGDHNNDDSER